MKRRSRDEPLGIVETIGKIENKKLIYNKNRFKKIKLACITYERKYHIIENTNTFEFNMDKTL